jgi:hypothetical protein
VTSHVPNLAFPAKQNLLQIVTLLIQLPAKINMFGLRKFNTPVLRPMAPFFIGTAAIFYLIGKAQTAMIESK